MSHQSYELKAEARERSGKGAARALRRRDMIPAVIYGAKKEPVGIALPAKELTLRLHGGGFMTTLATIAVGGATHQVLPKAYQLDPVSDRLMHVDFLRIEAGSKVTVNVPVHFRNEEASPGLERGGMLNIVRHDIELLVSATDIPEAIEIDLTGLEIGDSVHISSVKLPDGAEPTISDRDFTIATIAPPTVPTAEDESNLPPEAPEVEAEHGSPDTEADERDDK